MADHDSRIAQLKAEVANLNQRLDHEKAEREALQLIVIPPLNEMQKDLQLNIEYFTERLEVLKTRPAGPADDNMAEALAEIYTCQIQLLKVQNQADEHLRWLSGIVMRGLERQARLAGIEV
jgi:hypothetical protein